MAESVSLSVSVSGTMPISTNPYLFFPTFSKYKASPLNGHSSHLRCNQCDKIIKSIPFASVCDYFHFFLLRCC